MLPVYRLDGWRKKKLGRVFVGEVKLCIRNGAFQLMKNSFGFLSRYYSSFFILFYTFFFCYVFIYESFKHFKFKLSLKDRYFAIPNFFLLLSKYLYKFHQWWYASYSKIIDTSNGFYYNLKNETEKIKPLNPWMSFRSMRYHYCGWYGRQKHHGACNWQTLFLTLKWHSTLFYCCYPSVDCSCIIHCGTHQARIGLCLNVRCYNSTQPLLSILNPLVHRKAI